MAKGTVKFFNREKGFGFIRRDGEEDLFLHIKNVCSLSGNDLQQDTPEIGDAVEFEIGPNSKTGRPEAKKVFIRGKA